MPLVFFAEATPSDLAGREDRAALPRSARIRHPRIYFACLFTKSRLVSLSPFRRTPADAALLLYFTYGECYWLAWEQGADTMTPGQTLDMHTIARCPLVASQAQNEYISHEQLGHSPNKHTNLNLLAEGGQDS
eukprot:4542721-Pyramimonas_sp.AAC.1